MPSLYQNAVLKLSVRQYFSTHICVTGLLRVNCKNKPGLICFPFLMQVMFCFFEGAKASEQLQCYEDAISWCEKGLVVSLITSCFYVLC